MRHVPRWFLRYEQAMRSINRIFAASASFLTLLIVLLVLIAVAARIMGSPILWPYDIAQFALVYVFFLALAPALDSGHHVVVELFDDFVPRRLRSYVGQIAALAIMSFGAVFFWQLWRATSRAFSDDRLAVASIAVPLKWVYIIGPIGAIQFILTALADLGRAIWRSEDRSEPASGH